jgi:hypothetical protein
MESIKKINVLLDAAQKGCSARTLAGIDVLKATTNAEKKLAELGVPKRAFVGTRIVMKPAKVANSYKARAEGTQVVLLRGNSVWQVESVARVGCGSCAFGASRKDILQLGAAAVEAMPKEYSI